MSRTDYRTLLNWGRKAGLRTNELYSALSARPPEGHEDPAQSDSNGFTASYDQMGHRVYHPQSDNIE